MKKKNEKVLTFEELKYKYSNELLNFERIYKNHCTYSNEKISVYSCVDYRSELDSVMRLSEINSECDILIIEEK